MDARLPAAAPRRRGRDVRGRACGVPVVTPPCFAARLARTGPAVDRSTGDRSIWEVDGRDWPNRDSSRFVTAGGLRWHVQVAGTGPVVLLVHGTGAATHSGAPAPRLADRTSP